MEIDHMDILFLVFYNLLGYHFNYMVDVEYIHCVLYSILTVCLQLELEVRIGNSIHSNPLFTKTTERELSETKGIFG